MADEGGFWNSLGPYLFGAIAVLLGAIWTSVKDDVKWLKKNMTKVLIKLGIEADGE